MSKFQPRRFITNFVDGTAEFHDDDTPPAEEYLPLAEHTEREAELLGHVTDMELQVVRLQSKLARACEVLTEVENYLHWRTDDLCGDDMAGDRRLTTRFNEVVEKVSTVLTQHGRQYASPDTPIIWPSHKCGLYLNHNQHRDYYQSLSEYIAQDNAADFKDEAAQQRAIAADEIWELQWYPHTPVGFQLIAAPTLAEVLAWASEIDKTEKDSAK